MNMEGKVYYVHYRTKAAGAVTFALRERERTGTQVPYEVAAAFCAPRDQFSAAKGRLIARGRLAAERRNLLSTVIMDMMEPLPVQEQVQMACRGALQEMCTAHGRFLDRGHLPRWLHGFAGAWRREQEERCEHVQLSG